MTDTLPGGFKPPSSNALFATATFPSDAGTLSLLTIGRSTTVKPSSIQIDYELLFTDASLYGELGCAIRLETGDTEPYARVYLRPADGATLGYEVNTAGFDAGPNTNTSVVLADLLTGVWMHVATRLDFIGGGAATTTTTLTRPGQPPVTQTRSFVVPPAFDVVKIKCGMSYADDGPGTLGIAIDDVVARTCP